ncbi:MAG: beta-N-acetylhexosaminidase [Candidatus Binatia bacterium]
MQMHDILGQLFMVGIPQPTLNAQTRTALQELRPGGIILFRRNYTNPATLAELCADLHSLFPDDVPLIAIDHEGGRVDRLQPPFTHFPAMIQIGSTGSTDLTYRVGLAMGHELRSVGIDIDFAPVLDVFTNPSNTVIGDRAFSSDSHLVAQFGCALARGLRAAGVIPCGKHFPGHGGTLLDSHHELPRDERSAEELQRIDLYPFQQAINAGIEMLMTAHVLYPALDPDLPATLSPRILTHLLRQQLGFQGVLVSDDLEMGAIVRHTTVAQAVVDALQAGVDLFLVCHKMALALEARDACLHAVENGTLLQPRVEEALQRIVTLKTIHQQRHVPVGEPIGSHKHARLVEEIQQFRA